MGCVRPLRDPICSLMSLSDAAFAIGFLLHNSSANARNTHVKFSSSSKKPRLKLPHSLCRPFDDSKVTKTSGSRVWVDSPQSALINGQGYYGDCNLLLGGNTKAPTCNVTVGSVPPGRSALNPQAAQSNKGGFFETSLTCSRPMIAS